MQIRNLPLQALWMWFIATLFSFFQFFLQIMINTMTDPIMKNFSLSPGEMGLLSSLFFYPFIAMQIPAGYLLRKYALRKVLAFAALLCAGGLLLFAIAHQYVIAMVARLIMGCGAGFGFLGMLTITHLWFKSQYFSLMVGLSELIAMTLTALSEKGMVHLVIEHGWRETTGVMAILLGVLAILLFWGIKEKTPEKEAVVASFFPALFHVIKTPACLASGLFGFGMFSIVTAFSALWGLKFLMLVYHYTPFVASIGISTIFLGLALGCPIIGLLVANYQQPQKLMRIMACLSCLLTAILIFPVFSYNTAFVYVCLFCIGFASASYYLAYETCANQVTTPYKSMAMAFSSMFVMLGAILLQPTMGYLMETWKEIAPASAISPMQIAMMLLLLVQGLAVYTSNTKKS